jgi:very-short-patch-repair endonuclease
VRRAITPQQLLDGPFTTADAATAGISHAALQSSPWRRVFRDVWVHESLADTKQMRLAAVQLILGRHAFVCGHTAAWLHGIDARDRHADRVWVGCPTGRRLRTRAGCYTREVTVDATDLDLVDGVLVTNPVRTVFDCARWLLPAESIVVADALAHSGLIDAERLAAYRISHPGIRFVRRVDEVLRQLEPLSESPMETRLRMMLINAGLPRPTAQHVVLDAAGRFIARLDLAYLGSKVAVEYDGSFHFDQRSEDDRRRDYVRDQDWKVIVAGSNDLHRTPQRLIRTVRAAISRDLDERGLLSTG